MFAYYLLSTGETGAGFCPSTISFGPCKLGHKVVLKMMNPPKNKKYQMVKSTKPCVK